MVTQSDGGELACRSLHRTAQAFRGFLETLGLDLDDPNLAGTEHRVARAYREIFRGLKSDAEPRLTTFPNAEGYTGTVSVADVGFYSLCAHHFLPFFGAIHLGYIPGERLIGLSKLARVIEYYARRPQIQERLTEQIATLLEQRLAPAGVIVVADARHLCMEMRGVGKPGLTTRTIAARGAFTEERLRREFLEQHPPNRS